MLVHTTALTYYDSLSCNKCHHQLLLEYLIVLSFDFGSNLSRLSELSKIFRKKHEKILPIGYYCINLLYGIH